MAKVYFNHKLIIAFEIVRVKKAILWSEYNSTHLMNSVRKNYLVPLSLHFKVSTVTKELKIAFLLYIKASKDVSPDKFSLIIPEMLRFYRKSTYY